MAESLPPWLDVTPGSYTAAAEAGVSAGQRARSLDMEAQAHQQALQEAQAQKAQLQAEQALAIKDHAQQQATSRAAAAAQIQLQKQQIIIRGRIMSKKSNGINPDLEKAISDMLKQSMNDPSVELEAKLKVIDRAINLEKLKQKVSEDEWGSGFATSDDI